jgi:hypothetical protein
LSNIVVVPYHGSFQGSASIARLVHVDVVLTRKQKSDDLDVTLRARHEKRRVAIGTLVRVDLRVLEKETHNLYLPVHAGHENWRCASTAGLG